MNWDAFVTDASAPFRAALDRHTVTKRLAKGALLFDQGEHDDRLFILDEGLLEVNVISESGKQLALNQLRPVCVFGEIALFDPGIRTARVEAVAPSLVRFIRQSELMSEVQETPQIATDLLRLAGLRMRWLSAQVEEQVFLPPASRLAGKILLLMDADNILRMPQAKLADFVGVTREAVSKTLSDWRREGIIDISRGRITVNDPDTLRGIQDYLGF